MKHVLCLLLACGAAFADENHQSALLLMYQESEPGGAPYISRVIITERFSRFDYGGDNDNFVRFDHNSGEILSINHQDRTVLEIPPRQVNIKPPLDYQSHTEVIKEFRVHHPRQAVRHIRTFAKTEKHDQRCSDIFVMPGLLPKVAQIYSHYYRVLAAEHALTVESIPADMMRACDLSLNIFQAGLHYQFGLPVREMVPLGKNRMLLDYDAKYPVKSDLFDIPKGFRRFRPTEHRGSEQGA